MRILLQNRKSSKKSAGSLAFRLKLSSFCFSLFVFSFRLLALLSPLSSLSFKLSNIRFLLLALSFSLFTLSSHSQSVSINPTGAAPDPSAMLDVSSTTQGLLIPRMTKTQRDAISSPAQGLMIFMTTDTVGFFYHNGANWQHIGGGGSTAQISSNNDSTLVTTANDGNVVFKTTDFEHMRITSSGRIAVGNTAPQGKLHVRDTAGNFATVFENTASTSVAYAIDAYATGVGSGTNTAIRASASGATFSNYAAVFEDGQVQVRDSLGINTGFPQARLDVQGLAIIDSLNINNAFKLPSTDGTNGQVLQTDGSGNVSWANAASNTADEIADANNNTKIQVEESSDDNIIRFDMNNVEHFTMNAGRLNVLNTGSSVFIGQNAGLVDDLSANLNVFIGQDAGMANTSGFYNVALGAEALKANIGGSSNIGIGYRSLLKNTSGTSNIGVGQSALQEVTSGHSNVALGSGGLAGVTTGIRNAAVGHNAGGVITSGGQNTILGFSSAAALETGSDNVAIGASSLGANRAGSKAVAIGAQAQQFANNTITAYDNYNVALGYAALRGSTTSSANTGSNNVAVGAESMFRNTSGLNNVALGQQSLYFNTQGNANAAVGWQSLYNNNLGVANTAVGGQALYSSTGDGNTAVGYQALFTTTGGNNVAVGREALRQAGGANGNVAIGYRTAFAQTNGFNVIIGNRADEFNIGGSGNVIIGHEAGFLGSNNSKSGSVFIGNQAGYFETNSNRLYIDNSSTTTPLIYGDFANDSVKIFGTLSIGNAFTLPVADGTANQVLFTNGAKQISFGRVRDLYGESALPDTLGVHLMTSNLVTDTNWISGDGDNEGIYINNSGNVGIGTSSPIQKLDMRGINTDNAAILTLSNSDRSHFLQFFPGRLNDPNPFIQWKSGDPLRFATDEFGYREFMRISTDGRLGIGTDNVVQHIDIIDTVSTVIGVRLGADQADQYLQLDYNASSGFSSIQSGNFVGPFRPLLLQGGGGDVGINTLSTAAKLTIGVSDARDIYLQGFADVADIMADNEFRIGTNPASVMHFLTDSTIRMSITGTGNVGIGTASPTEKLEVNSNTSQAFIRVIGEGGVGGSLFSGISLESEETTNKSWNFLHRKIAGKLNNFEIEYFDGSAYSSRLTITPSGNVGIGTTDPDRALSISRAVTGDAAQVRISNSSGAEFQMGITGSDANQNSFLKTNANEDLYFQIGQAADATTPDMVIKADGNVGIGYVSVSRKLEINGDLRVNGRIWNDFNDRFIEINQQNTSSNNGAFTYASPNGASLLPESSNKGTVGDWSREWNSLVGINVWRTYESTISDRRAKMNIESLDIGLSTLMQLRSVRYDINPKTHPAYCNSDTNAAPVHQLGFIAQEVMEVIPEMVNYADAYGLYTIVNYEQLFPVVVKSIQEQQAQIEQIAASSKSNDLASNISYSDKRLKTDILPIANVLPTLDSISGVYHRWDTANFQARNLPSTTAIGLIAQDLLKVYPELVITDKDGFYAVDYAKFTAVLLQAIKEQQAIISNQQQNINELKAKQEDFEKSLGEIKAMLNGSQPLNSTSTSLHSK